MLISEEVEVTLVSPMIKYYEDLNYEIPRYLNKQNKFVVKNNTKIIVKVEDLPKSSDTPVEVKCDYCGKIHIKQYKRYLKSREIVEKDACEDCTYKKQKDVLQIKYGVDHITKIEGVTDKIKYKRKKFNNIEDLMELFRNKDCLLLSMEYINCESDLYFICLKHKDKGIQKTTYSSFKNNSYCTYCGYEKISKKKLYSYEYVKGLFEIEGYELLSYEYKGVNELLYYRCGKHPKHIQSVTLNNFKNNNIKCHYCTLENSRNNNFFLPDSDLFYYLRTKLGEWKKFSMEKCNYKCILTGLRFEEIHHLYSFYKIVYETLDELKLPLKNKISDYNSDEINNIINICLNKHYNIGAGICLIHDLHSLFHQIFGYSNNTSQQFEEFKKRYHNFEFDDLLEEKYKYKNILLKEVGI